MSADMDLESFHQKLFAEYQASVRLLSTENPNLEDVLQDLENHYLLAELFLPHSANSS